MPPLQEAAINRLTPFSCLITRDFQAVFQCLELRVVLSFRLCPGHAPAAGSPPPTAGAGTPRREVGFPPEQRESLWGLVSSDAAGGLQVSVPLLARCFAAPSKVAAGSRDLAGPPAPGLGLAEGLGMTVGPRGWSCTPGASLTPSPGTGLCSVAQCDPPPGPHPPRLYPQLGDRGDKGVNLGGSTSAVPW